MGPCKSRVRFGEDNTPFFPPGIKHRTVQLADACECGDEPSGSVKCGEFLIIYLLTAVGLSPGGSGYFTCIQNMKLVTNKFKSGGLHEKHVVATWNVGNRLSVCL